MKNDLSEHLLNRYLNASNCLVLLTLKTGRIVKGRIAGYCKDDFESEKPTIAYWHLVSETEKSISGTDMFGFPTGEFIHSEDIVEITFYSDNTVLKKH